jgi:hypothetical protein
VDISSRAFSENGAVGSLECPSSVRGIPRRDRAGDDKELGIDLEVSLAYLSAGQDVASDILLPTPDQPCPVWQGSLSVILGSTG